MRGACGNSVDAGTPARRPRQVTTGVLPAAARWVTP